MKKEIILTLLTFIFLSIGAYFCYTASETG